MNIALLTDLHIGKKGEDTYQIDVRKNLLDVLAAIQKDKPDRMLVAGDLCCYTGDVEIYRWIKQQLDATNIQYDLLVGNHDDGTQMVEVFGLESDFKNDCLYYTRAYGHWKALCLDTRTGSLSIEQLNWLEEQLHTDKSPIVIFMHHPPIYSDVPFMDEHHGLKNMEAVQKVLLKADRMLPIFTGHYHVEKTVCKKKSSIANYAFLLFSN